MGQLRYDTDTTLDVDDRTLAHLELVITSKLRREESFTLSWLEDVSVGSGRRKIWLHPSIPLAYRFHGNRAPAINRRWIEALMDSANSPMGLVITPEPAQP